MTPDRSLRIVWGAMVVSILVYATVAASFLRPRASAVGHEKTSGIDLWLEVEAAGTAWAAIVLWKTRRTDPIRNGAIDPESAAGRTAIRRVSIVCWALAESIAIFGLVLVGLRRTPLPGAAFLAAGFFLELLLFPGPAAPGKPA